MESDHGSIEQEQVVLGHLMLNPNQLGKVSYLRPEHFSSSLHADLYGSICEQILADGSVNGGRLGRSVPQLDAVDGAKYLAHLVSVGSVVSVSGFAKEVVEAYKRRVLVEGVKDILDRVGTEDMDALYLDLARLCGSGESDHLRPVTGEMITRQIMEDMQKGNGGICYPTGLQPLDKKMAGGVYRGFSYCFAGKPKAGKTMMLCTLSQNLADAKVKHLYIAAEMGAKQIHQRMLGRKMGKNSVSFIVGKNDPDFVRGLIDVHKEQDDTLLYISRPCITLDELKHAVITNVLRHNITGFVLDYIQLVSGKPRGVNDSEWQYQIAQWIAEVCKKENIWAVYGAQINRDGNIRGSDGAIMAADQVYQINRLEEGGEYTNEAWLAMMASRYTMQADVGSEKKPALKIAKTGTHFETNQED